MHNVIVTQTTSYLDRVRDGLGSDKNDDTVGDQLG